MKKQISPELQAILDDIDTWEVAPSMDKIYKTLYEIFGTHNVSLSVTKNGVCYYKRRVNGVGCAIGAIVPSRLKTELTEKSPLYALMKEGGKIVDYFRDVRLFYLNELQHEHDWHCSHQKFIQFLKTKIEAGEHAKQMV